MLHQIAVLERQLAGKRVRFTAAEGALLAVLLHRLPSGALRRMCLLVRPATVLRWHRNLVAGRHAARSSPARPGRPPTVRFIRLLVLPLVGENPGWDYRRVHGELLGCSASRSRPPPFLRAHSSVRLHFQEIVYSFGDPPAPPNVRQRAATTVESEKTNSLSV